MLSRCHVLCLAFLFNRGASRDELDKATCFVGTLGTVELVIFILGGDFTAEFTNESDTAFLLSSLGPDNLS
uniref:Uncharacterized protein n=1 Tax=Arundo donax TaxID=35708 RepID=A0A0A9DWV9_ARUDO